MSEFTISDLKPLSLIQIRDRLGDSFFERAVSFWKRTQKVTSTSGTWSGLMKMKSWSDLYSKLESSDLVGIRSCLENGYLVDMPHGVDFYGIVDGSSYSILSNLYRHNLESLAVASGFVRQFNPEQPSSCSFSIMELDSYLRSKFSVSVRHGPIPNIYGCDTCDGMIVGYKSSEAAITAIQVATASVENPEIVEIGSGFGFTAMAMSGFAKKIHTVDLPLMSVAQAFFMSCGLGESKVSFDGEWDSKVVVHGCVKPILENVDVFVNQNSLPEFDSKSANELMKWVAKVSNKESVFCSFNHESPVENQLLVSDLMRGWNLQSRTPSWHRQGYVDQVFRKA